MTAVASPSSFHTGLARNAWPNGNAQLDLKAMTPDEVSRMFMRRSNSSSSISSNSSTTTIPANPNQTNGTTNGDGSQVRKKPARALWPSTKAEPVSGLSTARSHSVAAAPSGPSAASAISALHTPPQGLSHHAMNAQSQTPANGFSRSHQTAEASAVLCLLPMNGTFERKTIEVPFHPDILKIGRQTNAKTVPTPANGYFDSKVLSRQHAEIWADREGKIWIRDIRSSNGTFVNSKRLSLENRDSEPHPLKDQDILELGIDIVSEDGKTIVHHKVAARVEHAGIYNPGNGGGVDMGSSGLSGDAGQGQRWHPDWRNRNGSQGSLANGRSVHNFANGASAASYHSKWLQPVTMEQVVKRLKVELRDARLQSQDLHHTSDFVDAVLSNKHTSPKPILQKQSPPHRMNDIKSRFAVEPPAPPPSMPLPEKPNGIPSRSKPADTPVMQPFLRRSDTEKPSPQTNGNALPASMDSALQLSNLREALQTAQREVVSQTERLLDMEETLRIEREARNSAEKRADRLLRDSSSSQAMDSHKGDVVFGETHQRAGETDDVTTTYDRFSVMQNKMDSMRAQVEQYRLRAEAAEQESQRNRQTLAEMVDSIQQREDIIRNRKEPRLARERQPATRTAGDEDPKCNDVDPNGNTDIDHDVDDNECVELGMDDNDYILNDDGFRTKLNGDARPHSPGHTTEGAIFSSSPLPPESTVLVKSLQSLTNSQLDDLYANVRAARAALSQPIVSGENDNADVKSRIQGGRKLPLTALMTQDQLMQTAPFASMLSVVLLGVGLMAWMNGWTPLKEP